jgi:hypothetical protein
MMNDVLVDLRIVNVETHRSFMWQEIIDNYMWKRFSLGKLASVFHRQLGKAILAKEEEH